MVGKVCSRPVVVTRPDDTIDATARLMRMRNVGAVVVVSNGSPIGLLTDRDVAVDVVGRGKDPTTTPVREVMKKLPTVIREEAAIFDVARIFATKGVRRLPVVNNVGKLVGIISLDDILILLGSQMGHIAEGLASSLWRVRP